MIQSVIYVPPGTTVTVANQAVPAPTISNARATPASLPAAGGTIIIDATVTDATLVTVDGVPVTLPYGVANVTASHTFALVAHGATAPDAQAVIPVVVATADPSIGVPSIMLAPNRALGAPGWFDGGEAYSRNQSLVEVSGPVALVARMTDNVGFGQAVTLTLTADGVPIATATTVAASMSITFMLSQAAFNALAEGWKRLSITGAPAAWAVLDTAMYVRKGATAPPQAWTPVYTGSYDFNHPSPGSTKRQAWAKVPAVWSPVEQPLPPRVCVAFNTAPRRDQLVMTQISPYRAEDMYRPCINSRGIVTTQNRQNYFYFDWQAALPLWPLLDGPRGRGSIVCPTSSWHGRTLPEGPKHYGSDAWRTFETKADGTVKTLAGYRDSNGGSMPSYWGENTVPELVGDWSGIPFARRGFHEIWDFIFARWSVATDPNAPPIGGDQPHFAPGPVGYVADTQNNRVCKQQHSATDREAPVVVTEFLTGLGNPWNLAEYYVGATHYLLVSERTADVVSMWDQATKTLVRTFAIQAPEGLRVMDDYAIVGSRAAGKIYKIDLLTNAVTVFRDLVSPIQYVNNNSLFCNVAVSDGTFGPRGMVASETWSNNNGGLPFLFNPNGTEIAGWQFAGSGRPGIPWAGIVSNAAQSEEAALSYGTCVTIAEGRLTFGTVQEGFFMLSKPNAGDVMPDYTAYMAGLKEWRALGYDEVFGHRGFGLYGLPLPWGKTSNLDAYMSINRHAKP